MYDYYNYIRICKTQIVDQKCDINITVANFPAYIFKAYPYILEGLPVDIVIGRDFLEKNKIVVDFSSQEMSLKKDLQTTQNKTEYQKSIKKMVENFVESSPTLGENKGYEHEINLITDDPVRSSPYTIPYKLREKVEEEIQRLLNKEIIRQSNSTFASPAFVIPKKNGEIRLVIDYRKLNDITKKESFPLPKIEELLIDLSSSKIFSTLDLNPGYHQINIKEEDKFKTAFVVPFGHFEFNKLPFGASNAPPVVFNEP